MGHEQRRGGDARAAWGGAPRRPLGREAPPRGRRLAVAALDCFSPALVAARAVDKARTCGPTRSLGLVGRRGGRGGRVEPPASAPAVGPRPRSAAEAAPVHAAMGRADARRRSRPPRSSSLAMGATRPSSWRWGGGSRVRRAHHHRPVTPGSWAQRRSAPGSADAHKQKISTFSAARTCWHPSQYPVARFSVPVVCNTVLLGSLLLISYHKKRLAAVQTVSAREHSFMLQHCALECVNNRTYRTLQESCDEGAPCALGQGSGALIGLLRTQVLPTKHEKTTTCCCSGHKILCCNMPSLVSILPQSGIK